MGITLFASIALPLACLAVARGLRLYASGGYAPVVLSCGWGIAARGLAFAMAGLAPGIFAGGLRAAQVMAWLAVGLLILRPGFTYFVDGAVYGLVAGIGLAAAENVAALARADASVDSIAAWGSALATLGACGSAGAWAGVALGWAKLGHGVSRGLALPAGWGVAAALAGLAPGSQAVRPWAGALALSALGLGACAIFIGWAWTQERRRWRDLAYGAGAAMPASLDALLAPVAMCFGENKRSQVAAFVRLRARVALRGRLRGLTTDAGLAAAFDAQAAPLRQELRALRRAIGVYCLVYARATLPPETDPAWSNSAWKDGAPGPSLFDRRRK